MNQKDRYDKFSRNKLIKNIGISLLIIVPLLGFMLDSLLVCVIGFVVFIFSLFFYRCPECKRTLDPRIHGIYHCPYCGAELREKIIRY